MNHLKGTCMKRLLKYRGSCYTQLLVYDNVNADDLGVLSYSKEVYFQGYTASEWAVAFFVYMDYSGGAMISVWEGELPIGNIYNGVARSVIDLPSGQVCIQEPESSSPTILGLEPGKYYVAFGWRKFADRDHEVEVDIFFSLHECRPVRKPVTG